MPHKTYIIDPAEVKNFNNIISERLQNVRSSLDQKVCQPKMGLPRDGNTFFDARAERIAQDNVQLAIRVSGQHTRGGNFSFLDNTNELGMRKQAIIISEMRKQQKINEENVQMVERLVNAKPKISSRLDPQNNPRAKNVRRFGAGAYEINSGSRIAQKLGEFEKDYANGIGGTPPPKILSSPKPAEQAPLIDVAQYQKMKLYMQAKKQ